MRNLFIACIFLSFVSQAGAGMLLSVNGNPAPDAITLNTSEMITHVFPLEKIAEAFQLRDDKTDPEAIHILIDCTVGA